MDDLAHVVMMMVVVMMATAPPVMMVVMMVMIEELSDLSSTVRRLLRPSRVVRL